GIERGLAEWHAFRQRDARLGLLNCKSPAGAGRVPVKLVVVGEKSDLPVGAIADYVSVLAVGEQAVCAADTDAHAVRQRLGDEGLRRTVAGDGLDVEADLDARTVARAILGRKIPQDAATNLVPFRFDTDSLGHRKLAVALDCGIADELQNALDRTGGR